ncbi:hypothetical protein FPV67DRAFT_1523362 [Lyophyllum atratum]|nr:hypothetical protein FPV67DRAFT_1523362 [Lyophyllum atratum]
MHLFEGVRYFLPPSLPEIRVAELSQVLDSNGATPVDSIDDSTLTHFITNSNTFERWQEVVAREEAGSLLVVTDKWVDRSVLLGKLQPPSCYSADPAMIFSGVVACAAELPASDLEVLSAGITALGGQWRTGLTKDVTHLFVISQTSPKYATALHFQEHTQVKVLLPHWFDDAVRLGLAHLDTTPYEWPDPPFLRSLAGNDNEKDTAKEREDAVKRAALRKLDSEKKTLYRTAELLTPGAPLPNGVDPSSQSSGAVSPKKAKNVWQGRRVLLGRSLVLVDGRREAVEAEIQRAGGEIVPSGEGRDEEVAAVDSCDVFVTRYRSGKAYVQAVRQAKTIGTLPWLFHVQAVGVLSPPMSQLLWYPIPRRTIDGFSAHEITVTNYTGESREYIKRLIAAMGATFTPSMSGKNTVLIAAYISGTKTSKAASWSIPVVNHTWLEDCFVKWRNLTVALEKYIVFPPGVDFSLMLGERGVGRVVEDIGEDELEILEQEDAFELEQEAQMEEDVAMEAGKKKKAALLGTQNSARDAREVEEAVGIHLDGDGDVQMEVELPNLYVDEDPQDGMDMVVDGEGNEVPEEENEEESPPPSRPTPTPKSAKSMAERLQEKGESTAKTRVKPRPKGAPKPTPVEERSSTPEVRVTRRKSGQMEVTPVKKRTRVVENGHASSSSSSSDEVEVVESVKKGKAKLVRRLGENSNSWVMDEVVTSSSRAAKRAAKDASSDEQEEAEEEAVKPKKRGLKKSPSKKVFSDDEEDTAKVEEVVVVKKSQRAGKRKVISEDDEQDSGMEVITANKGKRPSVGKQAKGKSKQRVESDEESGPEIESEEDAVAAVTSKAKGKAKVLEVEKKTARPKPKPLGKGKKVIEPPESEDEEEDDAPPSVKKPTKTTVTPRASTSKTKKVPTPPASEEDDDDATPPPVPKAKQFLVNKAQSSTQKGGKSKPPESETDEDEDDAPPPPPPPAKKKSIVTTAKPKGRQSTTTVQTPLAPSPSKTPKRVVSVLLPELTLSTKRSPPKAVTATVHTSVKRTESIRVTAGERASTSRSTAVPSGSAPKSKAKAKPAPPPPPAASSPLTAPSAGEDDMSVVISGRTKRSAATKATQKLHDEIMPDVMNYQQEMRSAGKGRRSLGASVNGLPAPSGSTSAGKRRQSTKGEEEEEEGGEEETRDAKRRRLSAPDAKKGRKASTEDESEQEPEPAKPAKGKGKGKKAVDDDRGIVEMVPSVKKADGKAKKAAKASDLNASTGSKKSGTVRLMTTQVTLSEDVVKVLTKLGVKITTRPAECTHLLAPHLVRTEKFLCALANAPFILTEKWATESAAAKTLLDEGKYFLNDKGNEGKFDFVLADALARAKELQGTLFSKMVFYITPKVPIDIKLLKNVVTACGGQVNTQPPTLRILNASPERFIISCPEDASIWRPVAQAHPVYTHELILTSALKQEINWKNESYRVAGSKP